MGLDDRIVCIDANFDNYIKIFTKQFNEEQATAAGAPGGISKRKKKKKKL
jgi:hypothetical protein